MQTNSKGQPKPNTSIYITQIYRYTGKAVPVTILYESVYSEYRKTIFQQVLKLGANEASTLGLQNAIYKECLIKFLIKLCGLCVMGI